MAYDNVAASADAAKIAHIWKRRLATFYRHQYTEMADYSFGDLYDAQCKAERLQETLLSSCGAKDYRQLPADKRSEYLAAEAELEAAENLSYQRYGSKQYRAAVVMALTPVPTAEALKLKYDLIKEVGIQNYFSDRCQLMRRFDLDRKRLRGALQ